MISRVWPSLTVSPTLTNGAAPGSGSEIGGADHRRPGSLTAIHLTANRMVLLASNTVPG